MKTWNDLHRQRSRFKIAEPDEFFSAVQIARLAELIEHWRNALNAGGSLSKLERKELDALVQQEFNAATARSAKALRDALPNYPTLLAEVRRVPGMYLGAKSLRYLRQQLYGIWFAEDFHQIPPQHRIGGFNFYEFETWVESKYNPERLTLSSFPLAEHIAGSDEAGFDLWFEWYDAFVAETISASP